MYLSFWIGKPALITKWDFLIEYLIKNQQNSREIQHIVHIGKHGSIVSVLLTKNLQKELYLG